MIFVTVGTHEQQFNRLIRAVDKYKEDGLIKDRVIIQTGFSTYEPQYCEWEQFVSVETMANLINDSKVVITHGGPASFMSVIERGKSPIVVPRKKIYAEHVNDHQVLFANKVKENGYPITVVNDVKDLVYAINNHILTAGVRYSNNAKFVTNFTSLVDKMIGEDK